MGILKLFSRQKYTAAIVGLGRIGFTLGLDRKREQPASHTMAMLDNPRISLVAGVDSNVQKVDEWKNFLFERKVEAAGFYGSAELYGSDFFSATRPDIIVVAVNEDSHMAECIAAIEARPKIVILEKPVALNSSEAKKIGDTAAACGVPVMVNHERRFAEDYRRAKEFLPKIGEIQSVRAELCSGLRVYAEQFEKDGSYSLIHDGTHLVDIVRFLLECPLERPKLTSVHRDGEGMVRNFCATYTDVPVKIGENQSVATEVEIRMSGRSKFFAFGVEILGTTGKICIGNGYAKFYEAKESTLYTGFSSLARSNVKVPRKTGYFSNMVQNAVDFLDGTAPLASPLEEAAADLRALEEMKALLR